MHKIAPVSFVVINGNYEAALDPTLGCAGEDVYRLRVIVARPP